MLPISERAKSRILNSPISVSLNINLIEFFGNTPSVTRTFDETEIIMDSFEVESSICDSGELVFGGCIASSMSVKLRSDSVLTLEGKTVQAVIIVDYTDGLFPSEELHPANDLYPTDAHSVSVPIPIFYGKIDTAKRSNDNRQVWSITAYDAFFQASRVKIKHYLSGVAEYSPDSMSIADIREWIYSNILINMNVYQDSAEGGFTGFNDVVTTIVDGHEEYTGTKKILHLNADCVNSVISEDTSVIDVLQAYFELNCRFGYINGSGFWKFINLNLGNTETIPNYIRLSFDDYVMSDITDLKIRYNSSEYDEHGYDQLGDTSCYQTDNILTSCVKEANHVFPYSVGYMGGRGIVHPGDDTHIFGDQYSYRPYEAELFAYWWLEPGDRVSISTGYDSTDIQTVDSYVFSRKISGSSLRVTISAQGVKNIGKDEAEYV